MKRRLWWVKFHRRSGVIIAFLVIYLSVTGIFINHSQELNWHEEPVYSTVIGGLYGVSTNTNNYGYRVEGNWIYQIGKSNYFNEEEITGCHGELVGVTAYRGMIAALCTKELMFLDSLGDVIESFMDFPDNAVNLLKDRGEILVRTETRTFRWDDIVGFVDSDLLDGFMIVKKNELPIGYLQSDGKSKPLPGISRERLLLDLHSGRVFGYFGVLVVDLVGVLLVMISISGIYTWGRKKLHKSMRKRNSK